MNEDARIVVDRTVQENGLGQRVNFHLSDCFANVPSHLQWDLIVGNPPHANVTEADTQYRRQHSPLIWKDADWEIHRRFYTQVRDHLCPGGAVVVQENHRFSSPDDFKEMIESAGLEWVGGFSCGPDYEDYYFLWSRLPGVRSTHEE